MLSMRIPNFSLDKMYSSPTCFNWKKVDSNWYIMHEEEKACSVKQFGDKKVFYCSENDFFDVWYKYFTIDVDYSNALRILSKFPDIKTKSIVARFKDVRLVRNPLEGGIIRTVIKHSSDNKYLAQCIYNSIMYSSSNQKQASIQNLGKCRWKDLPKLYELCNMENSQISPMKASYDVIDRLKQISSNAKSICIIEKLRESDNDTARSLLETIGLSKDEIEEIMLVCFADLNSKPVELLKEPIEALHNIEAISYMTWFEEELANYSGLLSNMLRYAFDNNAIASKLTDKIKTDNMEKTIWG